jgi:hypothetical protein
MLAAQIGTESARVALLAYLSRQGSTGQREFEIVDLVADLLHLARDEGIDPETVTARAELHYRAELAFAELASPESTAAY